VLESFDITVERVRGQVVRIVGSGEEVTDGQIPFTPRTKKVFEMALRESLSLGHNYIGTEHILLALVRENDGVGARILLDFDADPERVRHQVLRMLSGPAGRAAARAGVAATVEARARQRGARVFPSPPPPRPPLDWQRATILWRPEGLELRVPLALNEGAMAAFAADKVWSKPALAGLRREIWNGWLALASVSLLDEVDPLALRRLLDKAAKRALNATGRERGRVEDFLHRLREGR
jgi:hypothetical protein